MKTKLLSFLLLLSLVSFGQTQTFNTPVKFKSVSVLTPASLTTPVLVLGADGLQQKVNLQDLLSLTPPADIPTLNQVVNAGDTSSIDFLVSHSGRTTTYTNNGIIFTGGGTSYRVSDNGFAISNSNGDFKSASLNPTNLFFQKENTNFLILPAQYAGFTPITYSLYLPEKDGIFATTSDFKTINGESIVGSGDIVITPTQDLDQTLTNGNQSSNEIILNGIDGNFVSRGGRITNWSDGTNTKFVGLDGSVARVIWYKAGVGNASMYMDNLTGNKKFQLPNGGPADTDVTLPLSINGEYADVDGNITIATGGGSQDLQSVIDNGNTLNGNSISNSNGTRTSNLNNQGLNFYDSTTLYYSQLTHNSIVFSNGDGKLANLFYTGGNGTYSFPDKPNGYYTLATLDDIGGSQNLESVLTEGNTSDKRLKIINGSDYSEISWQDGFRSYMADNHTNFLNYYGLQLSNGTNNTALHNDGYLQWSNVIDKSNRLNLVKTVAGNAVYSFPENITGNYTLATLDDIPSSISTAFVNKTYASTMSVAYDSTNPNIKIDVTGTLGLTITGTSNGASGLVNLYFSGTQVATLNGFSNLVITGAGSMIPVYFIHDTDGIKWYRDQKITLTNTGTSGLATLSNNVLNIPQYASGTTNSDVFSKEILQTVDLTSSSGFTDTEDGVKGGPVGTETFTKTLPTIDYTKKFRIDVRIRVLNASTADAKVTILKSTSGYEGESYLNIGGGAVVINKTHTNSQGYSSIPNNYTLQYSVIGNGKTVTRSIIPISTKWDGTFATTYLPAFTGQIVSQTDVYNYNPSGVVEVFKDIDKLMVTGSKTSEVVIESINVQYFDDLNLYKHKNYLATLMDVPVLNDNQDNTYAATVYCPPNVKALVQWHHPNAYNGEITYGTFFSELFNNGYAVCFGTFNSFNNPAGTALWGAGVTSSNWGAPAGMVYRKVLMDYVDQLIKPEYHIQIGGSMGAFNAMTYTSTYPNKIRAVIGISGALDLTYNYNNGFSSVINKAYGASYRCILASTGNATSNATYWVKIADEKIAPSIGEYAHPFYDTYSSGKAYVVGDVVFQNYTGVVAGLSNFDLITNPKSLTKIPILLIHGDSDTTIDDVQSTDFQTAVNAAGGDVTVNLVTGANHLQSTLFNYSYIKSFLQSIR